MKVIVNFPKETEAINELETRVAEFHATLVLEKIKQLNINDEGKEKMLKMVLDELQQKANIK